MKKTVLPLLFFTTLIFIGCGSDAPKNGKVKLEFNAFKDQTLKINYTFSVHSLSNGDVTTFEMLLSGTGKKNEDGTSTLELKNDNINMKGNLQGQTINGSASGPDSVAGDAKLVAMPVFAFLGKSYRSIYNAQLDKKSEVQMNGNDIVDSSENKMQLYLHYPSTEIGVGDTWKKELLIKSGNKMNCSAIYSLREIKGDTAIISIEGPLDGKGESFGNEFTINGKLDGMFMVDMKTGWPMESDIQQDFTLKMGGKDIPMKYSINCKVEPSIH